MGSKRNGDLPSLPFRIGLGAAEADDQSLGAENQILEVKGRELGAAKGTGEADQEERRVTSSAQVIGETSKDLLNVGGQQRGLPFRPHHQGAADPFEGFTHLGVAHGGRRRVSGDLVSLGNRGKAAGNGAC